LMRLVLVSVRWRNWRDGVVFVRCPLGRCYTPLAVYNTGGSTRPRVNVAGSEMLFSDTRQAHPCELGFFIPEKDGLKTTSQTQHINLCYFELWSRAHPSACTPLHGVYLHIRYQYKGNSNDNSSVIKRRD
jgi:hypothetical protein